MTYCCAHLYGDYESYKKMLREIDFSSEDTLYFLGNMVDKGQDGIKILLDMMGRYNVYPLLGEQESIAHSILSKLPLDITEAGLKSLPPELLGKLGNWITKQEGSGTLAGYLALKEEMREGILDYFEEMTLYEELTVGKRNFVLVHAGLGEEPSQTDLDQLKPQILLSERMDYSQSYLQDTLLVSGHTATWSIEENGGKSVIYSGNGHIALDCDFPEGELACICLDTLEEFYV